MKNRFRICCYLVFSIFIGLFVFSEYEAMTAADDNVGTSDENLSCTVYTNRYFFIEINSNDIYEIRVADGAVWDRHHGTYFPALGASTALNERDICLKRNADDTTTCASFDSSDQMTLEDFYISYQKVATEGTEVTFSIPDGSGTTTAKVYEYTGAEFSGKKSVFRDFTHGSWFNTSDEGVVGEINDESVDLSSSQIEAMVNASALPHYIQFSSSNESEFFYMTIRRQIEAAQNGNDSVTPFDVIWREGGNAVSSIVSPALYVITYEVCEEIPVPVKYNATIDYFYAGTEKRVEFGDDVANPWTKSDLEDNYTETVTSPSLENCTFDKEQVEVKIEGKDFYDVVYYTCEEEVKFNATIDYFYEGTTERVEFDDEEDNPWKKTDLEDKYTETVTSPSKKNCTPDKEKVNVSINGKDFYDVVYYACEEVENPVTGTAFIIVATVVGAGAITGAAVYYNKKVKKKEDNV